MPKFTHPTYLSREDILRWMDNRSGSTSYFSTPSNATYSLSSSPNDEALRKHYVVGGQAAQFYQDLGLPPEVDAMDEEVQMTIARAVEERNCLQAEIDLASRRCRQHVFIAHGEALRAQKLSSQLDTVAKYVVTSVQEIVSISHSHGTHPRTGSCRESVIQNEHSHSPASSTVH